MTGRIAQFPPSRPARLPAARSASFCALGMLLVFPLPLFLLTACGGDSETPTIDSFKQDWDQAIRSREYEQLYALLDARSRRYIAHRLEVLRGLDSEAQQRVIGHLGGINVASLNQLTPAQYFALWWRKQTDGEQPETTFQVLDGAQVGRMTLTLDGQTQQYELFLEAGRWAWRLPPQGEPIPHDAP